MKIEELAAGIRSPQPIAHATNGAGETDTRSEFLWGCEAIARAIGRNKRVTYYMLERGELKSPRRIAGRWIVARTALLRELGAVS